MQSESSRRRRNDEFIDSQKLIFWWILLRPVTLLMQFRFLVKFPALGDLEPSPGRKWRRGIEIHAETSPKPSKLEKMTESRKTTQNFIVHEIFDLKHKFSLCWRSKSCRSRPWSPGEIRVTRRAYLAQLLRVIRWQGAASLKIKIKRQLEDFWPELYSVWKVGKFVLQFDNFPRQEKWNDERMQSDSSGRRRNGEFIGSYKMIFSMIFVTSCYVLNKIVLLSENSIPEWSRTIPWPE